MNLIQAHKEIWFRFTALRVWSGLSASIPWKEAKYGLKSLRWILYFCHSGSVSVLRNEGTFRSRITLYQRPPKRGSDSLYLRLTEKCSGSSKVGFVSSRLLASRKFSCWRMKYRNDPFFTKRSIRNKNDVHKWLILLEICVFIQLRIIVLLMINDNQLESSYSFRFKIIYLRPFSRNFWTCTSM